MESNFNATQRFSDRVKNYVNYRPKYPIEILPYLEQEISLNTTTIIADIGVGTGISAEHFVERGNTVHGVEPNAEMLAAAASYYEKAPNFLPINGTSETTTLPDQSIDLIIAGQAFHWFNIPTSRIEWKRVLKPNGHVALIWNDRLTTGPFLEAYEAILLEFGTDYSTVNHRRMDLEVVQRFFGSNAVKLECFNNSQYFDFEGLKGRINSSSYVPASTDDRYPSMMTAVRAVFDQFEEKGKVSVEYNTQVYTGQLDA
jgi:SAM-dependent methyltransferase